MFHWITLQIVFSVLPQILILSFAAVVSTFGVGISNVQTADSVCFRGVSASEYSQPIQLVTEAVYLHLAFEKKAADSVQARKCPLDVCNPPENKKSTNIFISSSFFEHCAGCVVL